MSLLGMTENCAQKLLNRRSVESGLEFTTSIFAKQNWRKACGFCRHVDKQRFSSKRVFAHKTWTAAKKECLWETPDHRLHKHTNTNKHLFKMIKYNSEIYNESEYQKIFAY